MQRPLLAALMLLALAACHKQAADVPVPDAGGPQIATSLDDSNLPIDKSDQITAIDAATGNSSGMPRDGGATVVPPKPQPRSTVQAPDNATAAIPVIAAPPPPAPAVTVPVPVGN